MLTDTGPLVAMIDRKEPDHAACAKLATDYGKPLITSWAVITEAMYLLYQADGWRGQRQLLDMLVAGDLLPQLHDAAQIARIRTLMEKYHDVPMDFADASLVALAESLNTNRIF